MSEFKIHLLAALGTSALMFTIAAYSLAGDGQTTPVKQLSGSAVMATPVHAITEEQAQALNGGITPVPCSQNASTNPCAAFSTGGGSTTCAFPGNPCGRHNGGKCLNVAFTNGTTGCVCVTPKK